MSSDSVAIITGAGRGIGRATAVALAGEGMRVALLARTAGELEETARLCGESAALALPTDVTDPGQIDAAVATTLGRFGRIDVAIHCAGLAPMLPIEQTTPQTWRDVIDTNLSAGYALCRAVWPIFRKQGGGAIVLVSSVAARDPFPGFSAYGAAKAAINALGLSLAREGAELGVRVHVVAPGATETAMLRGLFSAEQITPQQTMSPQQVAQSIVSCVNGTLSLTSGEVIYIHK
jgi:NAD(P)-dependent dehydrogenase (short-subunit alcohol dehydrogenase family)